MSIPEFNMKLFLLALLHLLPLIGAKQFLVEVNDITGATDGEVQDATKHFEPCFSGEPKASGESGSSGSPPEGDAMRSGSADYGRAGNPEWCPSDAQYAAKLKQNKWWTKFIYTPMCKYD